MIRRFAFVCCVTAFVAVACAKSGDQAAGDSAGVTAAATAAPPPAAITAADVAGTWNFRAVPEAGPDTTVTTGVLNAVGDTSAWTMAFTGRPPIKTRVIAIGGDSIVTETGPYQSVRRRGTQVTTTTVVHLRDGRLVGTAVGRYRVGSRDSTAQFRFEATKAP